MADIVAQPYIRVEMGNPSPEETAALVAALLTCAATGPRLETPPPLAAAGWRCPLRQHGFVGSHSWRAGSAEDPCPGTGERAAPAPAWGGVA